MAPQLQARGFSRPGKAASRWAGEPQVSSGPPHRLSQGGDLPRAARPHPDTPSEASSAPSASPYRSGPGGEARRGRGARRAAELTPAGFRGGPRGGRQLPAVVEGRWERRRLRATPVPDGAPLSCPEASPASHLAPGRLPTAAVPTDNLRSAGAEGKPSPPPPRGRGRVPVAPRRPAAPPPSPQWRPGSRWKHSPQLHEWKSAPQVSESEPPGRLGTDVPPLP